MLDSNTPDSQQQNAKEESFSRLLSDFEKSHSRRNEDGRQIEATVISVTGESVFADIGFKTEGVLPLNELPAAGQTVKPGDKLLVTVKGRDPEGYYQLSQFKVARPTDWDSLERAFAEKTTIVGTVSGVVKGGLSVDIGVRAFMPASRTGTQSASEMEKLVEQEIRCRIIKLDITDEDVVVDRRVVLEEEQRSVRERRCAEIKEGDVVQGEVRSLADYGAFVDLGGVDGMLHVGEIAWSRIHNPADVLTVGQQIEAKVIKVDSERGRISLSLKQLQPHPWEGVSERYHVGDRVRGVVTRVMDFGAFVELEPGIEGLVHVSEMSWGKKVKRAADVVKSGDNVEIVVLGINTAERRLSLGLKQALGDPWSDADQKFAPGTTVEGAVTKIMNFGAFVQIAEGVEGMIHVSEISAERKVNHPRDALRVGERVKAQVLAVDKEKRQIRLSIKQLVPSSLDEYLAEHKEGDTVSGRITEVRGDTARVELGEGVNATCSLSSHEKIQEARSIATGQQLDLSALTLMLNARWKAGPGSGRTGQGDTPQAGQVRSFRIRKLDLTVRQIELELA
jgi:small subunit ribosomal protein S1